MDIKTNSHGYLNVGIKEHRRAYLKSEKKKYPTVEDDSLYKEIIRFLFIRIWSYMFKERWIFTAPVNFGQFYIAETLCSSGYYKDWVVSKDKNKLVKKYNFHTSGRKFYIKWNKVLTKMYNKTRYKFMPYRGSAEELTGKRGLAAWIHKSSTDPYLEDFRGHLI